jgi:hypothetical protein
MLAVRNFGHFWSRELVDWGERGPGRAGSLRGYKMVDRRPFVVNFREQIAIYVLFTLQREAIYVGQTGGGDQRLFLRLRQHARGQLRDRWTNFSWFGLRDVNQNGELSSHQKPESRCAGHNRQALDEIESVLLQLFEPRLNKQGPRWSANGENTDEYLQYVAWEWGEEDAPVESSNRRLLELVTGRVDDLESEIVAKIADVQE